MSSSCLSNLVISLREGASVNRILVLLAAGQFILMASLAQAEDAVETIKKLEQELRQALIKADGDTLSKMLTDDFIRTPPTTPATTKSQWLEALGSGRLKYLSFETIEAKYRPHGDTVLVNSVARLRVSRGGEELQPQLRILDVWVKQQGRWLLASVQGNEMPPNGEQSHADKILHVPPTEDFEVSGDGSAGAWKKTSWEPLSKRASGGHPYDARIKMLYSKTGLYVLMNGSDQKLTATMQDNFLDLWTQDVFEFFLWPDERQPLYFEYEISPLGYELPILVPNMNGKFLGWRPWHYEGDRKTHKATVVHGGDKKPNAEISGWTAEVFVPYQLLEPLANCPPKPGTRWRANFYRVDYDDGRETSWDWARVGASFHEFQKFGALIFD
jgi:ketosteroid isomerase-like protein